MKGGMCGLIASTLASVMWSCDHTGKEAGTLHTEGTWQLGGLMGSPNTSLESLEDRDRLGSFWGRVGE